MEWVKIEKAEHSGKNSAKIALGCSRSVAWSRHITRVLLSGKRSVWGVRGARV